MLYKIDNFLITCWFPSFGFAYIMEWLEESNEFLLYNFFTMFQCYVRLINFFDQKNSPWVGTTCLIGQN